MIPRKFKLNVMTWALSGLVLVLALALGGNDFVTAKGRQNTPQSKPPAANQGRQGSVGAGAATPGDPRPGQRPDWKPWWQDEIIKKELNVTAEQDRKIQAIWDSTRPELEKYAQELKKQETELQRLMSPEVRADFVTVMLQIDKAEQQRTLANKLQIMTYYKMHRILTSDQDAKLKQIRDQRDRGRRGGGFR